MPLGAQMQVFSLKAGGSLIIETDAGVYKVKIVEVRGDKARIGIDEYASVEAMLAPPPPPPPVTPAPYEWTVREVVTDICAGIVTGLAAPIVLPIAYLFGKHLEKKNRH